MRGVEIYKFYQAFNKTLDILEQNGYGLDDLGAAEAKRF
jgi:hypothetical protein